MNEYSVIKLINTYDSRDEAENAEKLIVGEKRLASERDGTETVYNLFGIASWNNLYKLNMFNLVELQKIVSRKNSNEEYDRAKHSEIIRMLKYAAKQFELEIPNHWL